MKGIEWIALYSGFISLTVGKRAPFWADFQGPVHPFTQDSHIPFFVLSTGAINQSLFLLLL